MAVQLLGQLISPSLEVTVPLPVPARLTVRVTSWLDGLNVALTDFAALSVTVQVAPETVSHPLQAFNVDPLPGDAVSVTTVPRS